MGTEHSTGLSKTETAILANAARRDSLALLPLPRFIYVRGLSIIIALERLIRRGLVAERQAMAGEPVWRADRVAMPLGLTKTGLAALNGTAPADDGLAVATRTTVRDRIEASPYAISEDVQHLVLMSIMSRPQGADVKAIQQVISLPLHSVRAAISNLRAEGYMFDHVRDGRGGTTYQLIGWLPGEGGLEHVAVPERLHA